MTYTKNDRLVGTKDGVAILVKKSIIVNQEWKNDHFNVITDNEALAIEIELQNGDKVILATNYCPNGNPNRHTRQDLFHGTSDILDMAFISPGLSFRDLSFSVADNHMDSNHFPIQISLDKPLKRNIPLTEPCYQFDKTDDDLLHNTLKDSLNNIDGNITTQDELEELAVTFCDKLMKAVNSSTPKSYSRNSPISQAILDLIKEKRRLRLLYNSTQNPNTKSTINKLQKEIRTKIYLLAGENSATPLA